MLKDLPCGIMRKEHFRIKKTSEIRKRRSEKMDLKILIATAKEFLFNGDLRSYAMSVRIHNGPISVNQF